MLSAAGFHPAPEHVVVTHGRVRAGYRIGETLFGGPDAPAPATVVHVIGERPGNGHHTFSVYVTTLPRRVVVARRGRRSQPHACDQQCRRHGASSRRCSAADGRADTQSAELQVAHLSADESQSMNRCSSARCVVPPQAETHLVLRLPRRQQPNQRQHRGRGQVVADVLQAVGVGEPRGDVRRQRGAEDAGEVERERAAGIADRRGKQLRQHGAERPVASAPSATARRPSSAARRPVPASSSGAITRPKAAIAERHADQRAAAARVGEPCRRSESSAAKKTTPTQLHQQELLAAVAERGGAPRQREDRHQVEEHEGRERRERAEHAAFAGGRGRPRASAP